MDGILWCPHGTQQEPMCVPCIEDYMNEEVKSFAHVCQDCFGVTCRIPGKCKDQECECPTCHLGKVKKPDIFIMHEFRNGIEIPIYVPTSMRKP